MCFNSLQTGKCIQSRKRLQGLLSTVWEGFNSLQTGKCIQSTFETTPLWYLQERVSIPFKRESVSKVLPPKQTATALGKAEFQFPSNGKVYPKAVAFLKFRLTTNGAFQFPSNGKVYPKTRRSRGRGERAGKSFNSLQTGKCIQRYPNLSTSTYLADLVSIPFKRESVSKVNPCRHRSTGSRTRFNSLQTGKCIQRETPTASVDAPDRELFQFPSNGKVYPKIIIAS